MTDPTSLPALLARVEAATGGDREIDEEIAKTLLGWSLYHSKHGYWSISGPNGERATTAYDTCGPRFDPETGDRNPNFDREPTGWADPTVKDLWQPLIDKWEAYYRIVWLDGRED